MNKLLQRFKPGPIFQDDDIFEPSLQFRFLIRISAFLRKEIFEILRQPRLILTLVLGPFLILLLFGIGFRNEPRALRTLFVVEEGSGLDRQIERYASSLGPQLIYEGTTSDEAAARESLRKGQVDLVAVVPANAYETIRNNQRALFVLYHHEIDPFQVDYVRVFGRVYVEEVNRRVLRAITEAGQNDASTVQDILENARTSATILHEALERGDSATARRYLQDLDRSVSAVEVAVGASITLLGVVQQSLGASGNDETEAIVASLTRIGQGVDTLDEMLNDLTSYNEEVAKVAEVEANLTVLEDRLAEFRSIDASVLVSPFRSEAESIAVVQPKVSDYYSPSVIVLLLQHLAITFAALSTVRERRLGALELFRLSPISAGETLLGKYLSYLLFGGGLAFVLTLLLVFGLQVPMLGSWLYYILVIVALLFTALGVGFIISLLAETDTQAVQYSMIVLLASVFFSGFFLSVETLWPPVRTVSWALPATYAISLLRSIMLRGELANPMLLVYLTMIGLGFFGMAWFLLRQTMMHN